MSNTYQIMAALAKSDAPLSVERQRHIFNWAVNTKVDETLCLLCGRADLAPEVDAMIGELDGYKVRSSWLARPSRTLEEIEAALRGERRQRVLASLGAQSGLPGAVYELLLARSNGAVSLVALATGSAPEQYRLRSIEQLAATDFSLHRTQEIAVAHILETGEESREVVLRTGTHLWMFETAFKHAMPDEFDDEIRSRAFDILARQHTDTVLGQLTDFDERESHRGVVVNSSEGFKLRNLLVRLTGVCDEVGADGNERGELAGRLDRYSTASWHDATTKTEFDTLLGTLVANSGISDERLASLRGALVGDDDTLAKRAGVTLNTYFADVARVGFATRLFSEALQRGMNNTALATVIEERPTLWNLAFKYSDMGDSPRVCTLARHAKPSARVTQLLEHGAPATVAVAAWAQGCDPGVGAIASVLFTWAGLDDPEAVRALPASALAGAMHHSGEPAVYKLLTQLGGHFMDRYGSDPVAWKILGELGVGGVTTLGEVYDIIDASS